MFDKWKAKEELCKAYKIYRGKSISFLLSDLYTHEEYEQLENIQYAIAYILCEYFDFNYEFYYDNFPFSYKWYIANDYIRYYNECKKAYENIIKENNKACIADNVYQFADVKTLNNAKFRLAKGATVFCMETGCLYVWDGTCFQNLC